MQKAKQDSAFQAEGYGRQCAVLDMCRSSMLHPPFGFLQDVEISNHFFGTLEHRTRKTSNGMDWKHC